MRLSDLIVLGSLLAAAGSVCTLAARPVVAQDCPYTRGVVCRDVEPVPGLPGASGGRLND